MMIEQFVDYKLCKGDKIPTHVAKIKMMAQNLGDIGHKLSKEQIISKIITSLPSECEHVFTAWKNMPTDIAHENF